MLSILAACPTSEYKPGQPVVGSGSLGPIALSSLTVRASPNQFITGLAV